MLRLADFSLSHETAVTELLTQTYVDEGYSSPQIVSAFTPSALRSRGEVIVAESDGRVVGVVILVDGANPAAKLSAEGESEMHLLAVEKSLRGGGTGTALVAETIRRAQDRGDRRLHLYTQPSMSAAKAVYERAGFLREARRDFEMAGKPFEVYSLSLDPSANRPAPTSSLPEAPTN
ncbi:MAG: GNAT family N-acetyltransferase [Deltaproteobacteria bacterium]|nr:GNAT family N-acetyltransferase [Deltaproteobacteria bacterium]